MSKRKQKKKTKDTQKIKIISCSEEEFDNIINDIWEKAQKKILQKRLMIARQN